MKIRNSIRISIVLLTILSSAVAADCDSAGRVLPDSRTPEEITAEERENFLQARSKVQMSKVRFVGLHKVSITTPVPNISGEEICGWANQCLYEYQVIDRGNNLRVQDNAHIFLIGSAYPVWLSSSLGADCQIPNDRVGSELAGITGSYYAVYHDYTNTPITTDKDNIISGELFGPSGLPPGLTDDEWRSLLHEAASDVAKDRENRQERDYLDSVSCVQGEQPTPQP